MASTYGRRVPTWENDDIKEIYSIVREFGEVTRPGQWIAETLPFLADLPEWMQWWRPAALKYQEHQSTHYLFVELTGSPGVDEILESITATN